MIALVQRVTKASVSIENKLKSQINSGICLLLGINHLDNQSDAEYILTRLIRLKFFSRGEGPFEFSLSNIPADLAKPEILIISQFTLYADLKKGTRPSFTKAMEPVAANKLYLEFCEKLSALGYTVNTGEFGAYMQVELINDGPATFILSSDDLPHHTTTDNESDTNKPQQ